VAGDLRGVFPGPGRVLLSRFRKYPPLVA